MALEGGHTSNTSQRGEADPTGLRDYLVPHISKPWKNTHLRPGPEVA